MAEAVARIHADVRERFSRIAPGRIKLLAPGRCEELHWSRSDPGRSPFGEIRVDPGYRFRYGSPYGFCAVAVGLTLGVSLPAEADVARVVLWELRMPRLLLALLGGAAVGAAGLLMQAALRNLGVLARGASPMPR